MQAVILAAGMGKRLKKLTANNTKCMVKVNGRTLIERTLSELDRLGLKRIIIVVGYEGNKLIDYISTLKVKTPIEYVENSDYDKTNNIYSLSLAKEYLLQDDTLLLESDIIFERGVLEALIDDPRSTLALVDKYESWMDGTVVKIDQDENIVAFVPGKKFQFEDIPSYYKTVNIYKFSKGFSSTHYVPFLNAYSSALGNNEYYEQVLRVITQLDNSIVKAKRLNGQLWYEIDDIQDLDIAESLFLDSEADRLKAMELRGGGYWRYPKTIDFSTSSNPFFPPQRFIDEVKANLEVLLTSLPSDPRANALLVSKLLGVDEGYIRISNSEKKIQRTLLRVIGGKAGFVGSSSPNCSDAENPNGCIPFYSEHQDLSFTVEDIMQFYSDKNVRAIFVSNPDLISGSIVKREDCLDLLSWCEAQDTILIIDETAIDFADEKASLLDDETLQQHPSLVALKGISEAYGLPGICIGVLATSNEEIARKIDFATCNDSVGSPAEFSLQILEKYNGDYFESLRVMRSIRDQLICGINAISGLQAFPSQANVVLVRTDKPWPDSASIREHLLSCSDILLGSVRTGNSFVDSSYFRVAVRAADENNQLLKALKEYSDLI